MAGAQGSSQGVVRKDWEREEWTDRAFVLSVHPPFLSGSISAALSLSFGVFRVPCCRSQKITHPSY